MVFEMPFLPNNFISNTVCSFQSFADMSLSLIRTCLALLLFVPACSLQPSLIGLDEIDPEIEINGLLINGFPLSVRVNLVSSELLGEVDYSLPDAEVYLFENDRVATRLLLDTTWWSRYGGLAVVKLWSRFVTEKPVSLTPGNSYYVEASVPGIPTAVTARHIYQEVFRIDTVLNFQAVKPAGAERYAAVDFRATGTIYRNERGTLLQAFSIQENAIPEYSRVEPEDFLGGVSGGSSIGVVNPVAGPLDVTFPHFAGPNSPDRIQEEDSHIFFEYLFIPEDYTLTVRAIIERGGQSESFNASETLLSPVPYNAESGFGSFFLLYYQRLGYAL